MVRAIAVKLGLHAATVRFSTYNAERVSIHTYNFIRLYIKFSVHIGEVIKKKYNSQSKLVFTQ